MQYPAKYLWLILLTAGFCLGAPRTARAEDVCAICGRPIPGTVYLLTDKVTGEQKLVCSECVKSPRCYLCGLPAGGNSTRLADGRHLCARDAKTVVLKADDAGRICAQVRDDLDRRFSRFTVFPANVEVGVIDRIDVDSMFGPEGNDFESPNLLGCIHPETVNNQTTYKMRLMTGLPLAGLKATCAHEYSHAWVGENVPKERRSRLARDAEEGFCELVAYLLMDSESEAGQKKFILQNRYTRGQVDLFIEAEKRYGFDQVLDWMKYGVTAQLEAGHVEALRDVKMTPAKPGAADAAVYHHTNAPAAAPAAAPAPSPATLKLQGVLWGNRPVAIINGRSFLANDLNQVKIGGTNAAIRCLEIRQKSVRVRAGDSGTEQELFLSPN